MSGKAWTETEIAYLKARYPITSTAAICVSLGRGEKSVYMAANIHGIKKSEEYLQQLLKEEAERLQRSGKAYRYKKGQEPPNKGKKMDAEVYEKCKGTMFKKGTVPPNHRPVGFERICAKDGYVYVKVAEGMQQFRLKHRLIYEQHFGPIPKGCNVEFKDRNKRNFDPSNLVLRTRKENMKQNTYHNYGPEIAKAIQLRGALNRQINKHLKNIKHG